MLAFAACKKEEAISPCLEAKFEEMKALPTALSIRKQRVDDEVHYWLNDGTLLSDGVEEIFNGSCESVCYVCVDCRPGACFSKYDLDKWEIIWEK
jgi:hypothetical protein